MDFLISSILNNNNNNINININFYLFLILAFYVVLVWTIYLILSRSPLDRNILQTLLTRIFIIAY